MDTDGLRKAVLRIGVTLAAFAALPAAADASTVATDGTSSLSYTASAGETNQLSIFASGTDIVFDDPGASSITDADGAGGCSVSGTVATCPLVSFVATDVVLAGGNDSTSAIGNLAPLTALTIDAGPGADTVRGGNGADVLLGGTGNDVLDGNMGLDTVRAGIGNDTIQWDPGDASDVIEGQENRDTLAFNASNAGERVELAPNGGRLRLTRDIGSVTLDVDDVEAVVLRSFGSADTTVVNDLTGTDVTDFTDDLAATAGGGDGAADQVVVNGTPAVDSPLVAPGGGGARVTGLVPRVTVTGAEPSSDVLTVNGLGGDDEPRVDPTAGAASGVLIDGGADSDTVHARGTVGADSLGVISNGSTVATTGDGVSVVQSSSEHVRVEAFGGDDTVTAVGNLAALTQLAIDAGPGADNVGGGNGDDTIIGGGGADRLDGNQGLDTVLGGPGPDTFNWDPGDASDTLEGQENLDTLQFNGSNIAESIELSANGDRLRLTRNIATVTIDADGVEAVSLRSVGGADTTTVNDLTGTDVDEFTYDLSASVGGADGEADRVIVNGTSGVDSIDVAGSAAAGVDVTGLAPDVAVRNQDPSLDQLIVHTLAGKDAFDTDGLEAGAIAFAID